MCLHALVEFRASQVGRETFRDYIILGDDVSVFNKDVYDKLVINLGKLGVEVNPTKSTQRNCSAEIAKQFFFEGSNVTGFPLDLISQVRQDPMQLFELLRNITLLGYKSIPVHRVLRIIPYRFKGKVSNILLLPEPLGNPSALDLGALERGVTYLQDWFWPKDTIIKAYKYAQYDLFFKKAHILLQDYEEAVEPHSSTHSDSFPTNHPLTIGLGAQLTACISTLGKISSDDMDD